MIKPALRVLGAFDLRLARLPLPRHLAISGLRRELKEDQVRDVLARMIYGFRISVLFGLVLTMLGSIVGINVSAVQGFFGGLTGFVDQRLIEIGTACPCCCTDHLAGDRTAEFLVFWG